MDAWSGDPIPAKYLKGRTRSRASGSARLSGEAVPQLPRSGRRGRQAWAGAGCGRRQLTQDQLVRQVIQGGGNMPAYGKNLSPAETTALVAFLETLRPVGQAPARDASREAIGARQ